MSSSPGGVPMARTFGSMVVPREAMDPKTWSTSALCEAMDPKTWSTAGAGEIMDSKTLSMATHGALVVRIFASMIALV